jgi:Icc-related predicted phosphoesterase
MDEVARNIERPNVGCRELSRAVHRIKPKVHVFGHIHECRGQGVWGGQLFVNAAQLEERDNVDGKPIVVDL